VFSFFALGLVLGALLEEQGGEDKPEGEGGGVTITNINNILRIYV